MTFLKGGRHLWTQFSQSFSDKNEEFLCSSERKFPELFKTHPTFVYSAHLVASIACQTLTGVFFGTPCMSPFYNIIVYLPLLMQLCQIWDEVTQASAIWFWAHKPLGWLDSGSGSEAISVSVCWAARCAGVVCTTSEEFIISSRPRKVVN